MDAVVLDTDVISFLAKGDTGALLYVPLMVDKQLCVSFQTVAELRLWAILRRGGFPAKGHWIRCFAILSCYLTTRSWRNFGQKSLRIVEH